ncbi:MAG TPA: hypothetical protein VK661_02720 [Planctomycetota bacterium]|nr:hypothetical protein [Planctomycetota bacterium]
MTAEERASLESITRAGPFSEGCVDGCVQYFISLVGGPVLGILAAAALGVPADWLGAPRTAVLVLLALGGAAGFLFGLRAMRRFPAEIYAPYRRDLAEGELEIINCTIFEAVEVVPIDDEGTGYFLDVGDGALLFLQGQDLDEDEDEAPRKHPRQRLHLVRSPYAGHDFEMEWSGDVVPPSRSVDSNEFGDVYVPTDGELIPAALHNLESDLKRLYEQKYERGPAGRPFSRSS